MTVIHGGAPPYPKKNVEMEKSITITALAGIVTALENHHDNDSRKLLDKTVQIATALDGTAKVLINAMIEYDDAIKSFEKMTHPAVQNLRLILDPLQEFCKLSERGDLDRAIKKLTEVVTLIERMKALQQDPEMNRLMKQIFGGNP